MKCKHENADHLMPGEVFAQMIADSPLTPVLAECLRCIDCCAWLSLGPSRDDGPHEENVAIELRAAELAANHHDMEHRLSGRFKTTYGEVAGWRGEEVIEVLRVVTVGGGRTDRGIPLNLSSPNWQAGYLARLIARSHDGG